MGLGSESREIPTTILAPIVGAGIGAAFVYAMYQFKPAETTTGMPVWGFVGIGSLVGFGIGILVSGDTFR